MAGGAVVTRSQSPCSIRGVVSLDDYISNSRNPGPWERHSWAVKLARGGRKIYILRGRGRIYTDKSSKVNALRIGRSGVQSQGETCLNVSDGKGNNLRPSCSSGITCSRGSLTSNVSKGNISWMNKKSGCWFNIVANIKQCCSLFFLIIPHTENGEMWMTLCIVSSESDQACSPSVTPQFPNVF